MPWLFDEEAVDVMRSFTKLKCRLMPYIYQQAVSRIDNWRSHDARDAARVPRRPDLRHARPPVHAGRHSLLVAPVFSADGWVEYYVPEGRWTHYLSGEVVEGPRWQREQHDFLSVPLLVRPNSVIAVGAIDDRPDYDYTQGLTLRAFELAEDTSVEVVIPTLAGARAATIVVGLSGGALSAEVDGELPELRYELVGR